jgi:DNA-binding response OmpR family regulator
MSASTVLIIDDDEDVRAVFRDRLEADGFIVHTATDGDDGVKRATELEPDAILLDYTMPAVDGYEVLEMLRRRKIPTRVIFMSGAFMREEDKIRAMRLGACAYLVKPIEMGKLVATVRRAIALEPTLDLGDGQSLSVVEQLTARTDRLLHETKQLRGELEAAEATIAGLERAIEAKDRELEESARRLARRGDRHTVGIRLVCLIAALAAASLLWSVEALPPLAALLFVPILYVLLLFPLERAHKIRWRHGSSEGEIVAPTKPEDLA